MKKILFFTMIGLLFLLTGCINRNINWNAIKDELSPVFSASDTKDSVTSNVILKRTSIIEPKAEVFWISSDEDIISNEGVVTAPIVDTIVTLSARVIVGAEERLFEYQVKVLKNTVTVTFDSRGGSEVLPIEDIEIGETISQLETPVREHYDFVGWIFTNAFGHDQLLIEGITIINQNISARALWVEK